MLRLLALCVPAIAIMSGFCMPFFIASGWGYAGAVVLVVTGSAALWIVEKKTVHRLEQDSVFNSILNTNDGTDE